MYEPTILWKGVLAVLAQLRREMDNPPTFS